MVVIIICESLLVGQPLAHVFGAPQENTGEGFLSARDSLRQTGRPITFSWTTRCMHASTWQAHDMHLASIWYSIFNIHVQSLECKYNHNVHVHHLQLPICFICIMLYIVAFNQYLINCKCMRLISMRMYHQCTQVQWQLLLHVHHHAHCWLQSHEKHLPFNNDACAKLSMQVQS